MARKYIDNIVIKHAHIFFRNFAGKGDQYNREGDRNFSVSIDPEIAQHLIDDGWNVKMRVGQDPDEEPSASLKVSVSYKLRAPRIRVISNGRIQDLDEGQVKMLDSCRIADCGVVIQPSFWEMNGRSGIKAYLDSMYAKLEDDPFADIYAEFETGGVPVGEDEDLPF